MSCGVESSYLAVESTNSPWDNLKLIELKGYAKPKYLMNFKRNELQSQGIHNRNEIEFLKFDVFTQFLKYKIWKLHGRFFVLLLWRTDIISSLPRSLANHVHVPVQVGDGNSTFR